MEESNRNKARSGAGHGSVVTDVQGRGFYLYHAYKTNDFVYPGRQGLLDEITWGEDKWPHFDKNAPDQWDINDEFSQPKLSTGWQWPASGS